MTSESPTANPAAARHVEPAAAGRMVIVGGGLAGLAAAAVLAEQRPKSASSIELWEARRRLGGRAGSYFDAPSGQWVDLCQHVSMGCCTNLADFCRRAGLEHLFRRDRTLWFIGTDGRSYALGPSAWLPAPLHLAPALVKLGYLSLGDRWCIVRAMWRLLGMPASRGHDECFYDWLLDHGQSKGAIERFWSVILISALAEHVQRISLAAARKVFVDGFLVNRRAADVEVPQAALGEIYGQALTDWLNARRVTVRTGMAARRLRRQNDGTFAIDTAEGEVRCEQIVLAVPWRQLGELLDDDLRRQLPWVDGLAGLMPSPITGVHLWFDRPIFPLPHAVLVGRLSQWVFAREPAEADAAPNADRTFYYQVVISASHPLADDRAALVERVHADLREVFNSAREARLLRSRVISEPGAVFSPAPGVDAVRPQQATPVPGLFVAGDWTATGWPATMEGAVRSGRLAANALLASVGQPGGPLCADLRVGLVARLARQLARWLPL